MVSAKRRKMNVLEMKCLRCLAGVIQWRVDDFSPPRHLLGSHTIRH